MCSLCDNEYDYDDYDDNEYDNDDYESTPDGWGHLEGRSASVDIERLLKEVTYITVFPERWNQGDWVVANEEVKWDTSREPEPCGTMGCLAGNAVINAGGRLKWEKGMWYDYSTNDYKEYWKTEYVFLPANEEYPEHIETAARDLLGLNSEQADALFSGDNTLDDMWEISYAISDGQITPDDRLKAEAELKAREENGEVRYVNAETVNA